MRYRQAGNLAYKRTDEDYRDSSVYLTSADGMAAPILPDLPYEFPDLPQRRRQYEEEKRRRQLELAKQEKRLKMRALYKTVGLERAKSVAFYVSIILAALIIMSFVMFRQSKIVEQNFAVTRLRKQLEELEAENAKSKEEFLSSLNLNEIKEKAFVLYGLRDPAQAQRIHINLPEVDRVIRYSDDAKDIVSGDIVKLAGSSLAGQSNQESLDDRSAEQAGQKAGTAALRDESTLLSNGLTTDKTDQEDKAVIFDSDLVENNLKKLRLQD